MLKRFNTKDSAELPRLLIIQNCPLASEAKKVGFGIFELVNIDCDILTNISKYVILKMPNKDE